MLSVPYITGTGDIPSHGGHADVREVEHLGGGGLRVGVGVGVGVGSVRVGSR